MRTRRAEHPRLPRDAALWRDAVRGVAPLQRRHPARPPAPPAKLPVGEPGKPEQDRLRQAEGSAVDRFVGIDRATAERLKRGLRAIEASLDLHGMSQAQAYRALAQFVRTSSAAGRRCVLVITGRGLATDRPGILKSAVPRWLGEAALREQILAFAEARPRHGGAGALYVLLRRRR
jgi:DNA-nicking Smr family endonuclease